LLAKGDFSLQRSKVHAFSDVAVADGLDVFLGILGVTVSFCWTGWEPFVAGLLLGGRRCLCGFLAGGS